MMFVKSHDACLLLGDEDKHFLWGKTDRNSEKGREKCRVWVEQGTT